MKVSYSLIVACLVTGLSFAIVNAQEISAGAQQEQAEVTLDDALSELERVHQNHVNVLSQLYDNVPAAAQPGIQRAIENSQRGLQQARQVKEKAGRSRGGAQGGGGQGRGGRPDGVGQSDAQNRGGRPEGVGQGRGGQGRGGQARGGQARGGQGRPGSVGQMNHGQSRGGRPETVGQGGSRQGGGRPEGIGQQASFEQPGNVAQEQVGQNPYLQEQIPQSSFGQGSSLRQNSSGNRGKGKNR